MESDFFEKLDEKIRQHKQQVIEQMHKRNKAQTLRLYNRATREWSIYLVDVDEGTLNLPPVIGHFSGKRGEFYDQEPYNGRTIWVRFIIEPLGATTAHSEQAFSDDNGRTWEVNWINDYTRLPDQR